MSFEINQGLFQFGFTDNHAILGVRPDADFNTIRKRYMKIARRLHPDTCPFDDPRQKELGKQLLAKLVSPAYNQFSKENERREYELLLKTMGDRVVKEQHTMRLHGEAAAQLRTAGNFRQLYDTLLEERVEQEYESPEKALERIGEISELNLVYLLRSRQGSAPPPPPPPAKKPEPAQRPTPQPKVSFVDKACDRAAALAETQNYASAILELKDAVKREPNHPRCHGLLGSMYLKQKQPKLATPHIKKALQLDPAQPEALEAKKELDKMGGTSTGKGKTARNSKGGKKSDKGGGGLFGGLFGGGKKK
ncbi:DnaJ domain-containing protein [Lyngbya sp. CCY1209]|jgi:curved DNA-binding protein CbpA|uniref:J domain-containing protein n=1 Tax=Lyngbya sp. CCY1209 TaxID=2886103 RepID=UPI002D20AC5A|nr:DnaJ domain-containing protein [Lyngbya sp. CCY1209]MEB3884412.1 DnaJ domain-containing protein [Lyngbya sp. CCY1209]